MVTLKMLAKACNVSTATVSKALNNAPDISTETAARVCAMAQEMGYIPCAAARYLKTSRTHSFGVIFSDGTQSGMTHEFFAWMLDSFKRRAEELGYDITLISDHPGPWGRDYATHVKFRNCDGVAVLVADNAASTVPELIRSGIPVVCVDYSFDNCSIIRSDNITGMRSLTEYVFKQGHRRIAAIFGEDSPVTRQRTASFFNTCEELGLEIPNEYIINGIYHDTECSAAATRILMNLPQPPTCILYPDDFSFFGGKSELESMGLTLGKDISAAGYDGIQVGKVTSPPMTTVGQNSMDIGAAAATELVRAVEEGRRFLPKEITVPCSLIPGGTVCRIDG